MVRRRVRRRFKSSSTIRLRKYRGDNDSYSDLASTKSNHQTEGRIVSRKGRYPIDLSLTTVIQGDQNRLKLKVNFSSAEAWVPRSSIRLCSFLDKVIKQALIHASNNGDTTGVRRRVYVEPNVPRPCADSHLKLNSD